MSAGRELFAVEVEKESLIFSAAHFITVGEPEFCEAIHGHNYRVSCRVTGGLNRHGYVIDFIALRDRLQEVTRRWDHRVLLPATHPRMTVVTGPTEVEVRYADRRWIFPASDCCVLPVSNTTAELLAQQLFRELQPVWDQHAETLLEVEMRIDENEGQWGCYRYLWPQPIKFAD